MGKERNNDRTQGEVLRREKWIEDRIGTVEENSNMRREVGDERGSKGHPEQNGIRRDSSG